MKSVLKESSQALIVRGVVAIIFAFLLLFLPGITLATGALSLVMLFAAYALVDGISTIYGSVKKREGHWVWMLLVGIVSVIAGLVALAKPVAFGAFTAVVLVHIIAIRAVIGGVLEIYNAWKLREEIDDEWLLGISGFASLVFGFILLTRTIDTLATLLLILPFYLLIAGALQIGLGVKVRNWTKETA